MIHLLPILRFPWQRKTPSTPLCPVQAAVEPTTPPPPKPWLHAPPPPPERAESCGHCGEPIPETSVDGEFCSPAHSALWLNAQADVITRFIGPTPVKPQPGPEPAEPPWLAAITAWDQKRTERVMESRKAPSGEKAA